MSNFINLGGDSALAQMATFRELPSHMRGLVLGHIGRVVCAAATAQSCVVEAPVFRDRHADYILESAAVSGSVPGVSTRLTSDPLVLALEHIRLDLKWSFRGHDGGVHCIRWGRLFVLYGMQSFWWFVRQDAATIQGELAFDPDAFV